MDYEHFMIKALEQAKTALKNGEFPVGCVLVYENKVIATGSRIGTSDSGCNEIDHAEMVALRHLQQLNPDIAGDRITLFCTMEPCLMCYGAILISGINNIVYAYEDVMGGGTGCDLTCLNPLYRNRSIQIVQRVMRSESLALFKAFFSNPANDYWQDSLLSRYTLNQTG